MSGLPRCFDSACFAAACVRFCCRGSEIVSGVEERLRQLPHAENDPPRRAHEIYRPRDPRGEGWGSLSGLAPDKDAIQTRDYCVAANATHRADRPDPSLRKIRLLGMTIECPRFACRSPSGSIMLDSLEAVICRFD